jgi:hypothetical protein
MVFIPKVKVEIAIGDNLLDAVIEAIERSRPHREARRRKDLRRRARASVPRSHRRNR